MGGGSPLEQVRIDCGVSRDGSKASSILLAAQAYGLKSKGMAFPKESVITKATVPCVFFWNFNHFVVLCGFRGKYAFLNDPARGQVKIPLDEFFSCFTGVAILFEKTDAFEEGGQKPDTLGYASKRLKGLGSSVTFVMLTALITSFVGVVTTSLGKVFLDHILTGHNPEWLGTLLVVLAILGFASGFASILSAVYLMRIQGKIAVVSSSRFLRHLLHLPVGFYSQRMVGDLQQRQSANETIAFTLVGQLAPVLINSAMLVLYLVIMVQYSLVLTLVGVTTVVANALLASFISKKRINIARSQTTNAGKLYATTVSGIEMVETIRASGSEVGFFGRWAGYQAAANMAETRTTFLNAYLGSLPAAITQLANVAVLVIGIWLIVGGDFTSGALLSFTGFLLAFVTPVSQIVELGQTVQEMQTQMERIEDVMRYECDVPEDVVDDRGVRTAAGLEKLGGQIDLEGVTFGYSPLEPPLIEGFDLHVKPGQWVALVGESGCGKSTLSKLISGLYDVREGEIRFDGIPIKDVPRPVLRSSLAVVDQDIVTFDDTISDNVTLWDRSIQDLEVMHACRDADIDEVITSREGGYNSRILPGGQKLQRRPATTPRDRPRPGHEPLDHHTGRGDERPRRPDRGQGHKTDL